MMRRIYNMMRRIYNMMRLITIPSSWKPTG
jgi:hypothetical protein